MISLDETFMLLRKWSEEGTLIRFDGRSSLYSFSLVGKVESATGEVVTFRVGKFGYIEIHLPPDTGFEYFDPEALHTEPDDRIGEGQQGEPVVYGTGIVAVKRTGEQFKFLEVVSSSGD
jgi:hypothetical protein